MMEIQQLCYRYALAADSRDLDLLVSLFVPDVRVGSTAFGRAALRSWYSTALRSVGATIHLVANHTVEIHHETATGVVYCREEVEELDTGQWRIGMLQYWDDYRRVDREWLFDRRRVRRWYSTDALTRPQRGAGVYRGGDGRPNETALPDAFATWVDFWGSDEANAR